MLYSRPRTDIQLMSFKNIFSVTHEIPNNYFKDIGLATIYSVPIT